MAWLRWALLIGFGGPGLVLLSLGVLRSLAFRRRAGPIAASRPGIVALGIAFLMVGAGTFLVTSLSLKSARPALQLIDALQQEDYAAAFAQCDPRLQAEFDGLSEFAGWAESLHIQRVRLTAVCGDLEDARADGRGRFENGERFDITFYTTTHDGEWKIEGIRIWTNSLESRHAFIGRSNSADCFD